jgi:outer membrane protein TolC
MQMVKEINRFRRVAIPLSRFGLRIAAATLICGSCAFAQFGAPGSSQGGSQATQLPLSGRTGQAGGATATQTTVPGTTTSVDTLNPSIQVQGPYTGSANSTAAMPFSGKLGLREAIQRGVAYNLGATGQTQAARQAKAAGHAARSALLPNVYGTLSGTEETENLQAFGLHFSVPGFNLPTVVGPFDYLDLRANLTQTILDLTALNNYRSANQISSSDQFSALDAKDLVVLAVSGTYLQVLAAKARVDAAQAQLDSANALYQQTLQQRNVGLVAQIDANRSQVEALTEQQRLLSLQNDLAKQKINLARLTGLPPTDQYELSDDVPFAPAPPIAIQEALQKALAQRSDLKAAQSQLRAAELARSAARSERLPSISASANFGAIGPTPAQARATFAVAGTVRVPIWLGGRTEADITSADAALTQRQAELDDLKSSVEAEVRNAYLDLQTATNQVELAKTNLTVSQETLVLTRQRFDAGVTDSVEVVQTEQTVATAQLDYINSIFAHNVAKLSLARAIGGTADNLAQFLKLP